MHRVGQCVLTLRVIHTSHYTQTCWESVVWAHRDPHILSYIHMFITHPHGQLHISANSLSSWRQQHTSTSSSTDSGRHYPLPFSAEQPQHDGEEEEQEQEEGGERRFSFTHLSTCLTHTHVYTSGVLHSIHQQWTHCGGQHSNQCVLSLLYSLPIRDQLLVVSQSD